MDNGPNAADASTGGVLKQSFAARLAAKDKRAWIILAIPILLVCLGWAIRSYTGSRASSGQQNHSRSSKLTYRTILFDKYVVAGNAYMEETDGAEAHLSKGIVYYVKGEADVSFDLSQFTREADGTLSYTGQKLDGIDSILPYCVEVRLAEADIYNVYEIEPHPINPGEARIVGAAVGTVAAVAGGYLGVKAGGMIGNTAQVFSAGNLPFAGVIGAISGGGLGAATGGVTGFVLCNKYLTGLTLTRDLTEADTRTVLDEAKKLIAAELLFDPDMQVEFTKAFCRCIEEFYAANGQTVKRSGAFVKMQAAATTGAATRERLGIQ